MGAETRMLRRLAGYRRTAQEIRDGLRRGEFYVLYQPIVHGCSPARPYAFEGLVRWDHPERGLVGPAAFIPVAEEMDLIYDLGRFVLSEACRFAQHLRRERPQEREPLLVTVNVSPYQLHRKDFARECLQTIAAAELPVGAIILEITEGVALEDAASWATLGELRAAGIPVAIDDFGSGYSTLSRLRDLPAEYVKLDRYFLRYTETEADRAFFAAIVRMARALDLRLIIEGVETAQHYRFVQDQACDFLQGFHFHSPMPEFAVLNYLAKLENAASV